MDGIKKSDPPSVAGPPVERGRHNEFYVVECCLRIW